MKKYFFTLLTVFLSVSYIYAVPLAGIYTVGTGGDYTSLAEVRTALTDGISAPVEFRILPGTYTEQVEFNFNVSGSSEENTITFTSSTGNRDDVIIQFEPTINANYSYVFSFMSTSHFIVRELTLYNYSSVYGIVVKLTNCSDIIIDNCMLKGLAGVSNLNSKIIYAHAYQNESGITISNNEIADGNFGIEWTKDNAVIDSDNVIINNIFSNITRGLINIEQQNNMQILKNYFYDTITLQSNFYGFRILNCTNTKVKGNTLYFNLNTSTERTAYGIYLDENVCAEGTENIISNNFISIKSNNTLDNIFALFVNNYNNLNMYFNTTSIINGGSSSSSSYFSNDAGIGESRVLDFRDNNIVANSNGCILTLSSEIVAGSYFGNSDYNNFFQQSNTGPGFSYNAYLTNDLEEFVFLNSSDTHSICEAPYFVGDFDLHLTGMWKTLTGKGIAIDEYTTDIDGQLRNSSSVEIGADELPDVDIEIVEILNPYPTCTDITYNPEYRIRNNGPDDVFAGQIFLGQVYIAGTLIENQYFSLTEELSSGEEQTFTFFEEYNLSIPGNYSYTFIAENIFDDNRVDTVVEMIPYYFKPAISFQTPPESVCRGSEAGLLMNFTGTAPFDVFYEYGINQNSITGYNDYELLENIQISEETEISFNIIDANGCLSDTFPLSISVIELPVVIYTGETSACQGSELELSLELTSGVMPWSFTANNETEEFTVSGINTNEWINDTVFENPFYFTILSYTDANGCAGETNIYTELTLLQLPESLLPEDTTICNDDVIELHAGNGFISYLWQDGEGFESTDEYIQVYAPILETGTHTYYCTLSNENCINTDSISVTIEVCESIDQVNEITPQIWPIPSSEYIIINSPVTTSGVIFSESGKIVKQIVLVQGDNKVDIPDVNPGIYLIKICGLNSGQSLKFIKE